MSCSLINSKRYANETFTNAIIHVENQCRRLMRRSMRKSMLKINAMSLCKYELVNHMRYANAINEIYHLSCCLSCCFSCCLSYRKSMKCRKLMSMTYAIVKNYANASDSDSNSDSDNDNDSDNDKMKMIKIFHEDKKTRRHVALD